MIWLLRRLLIVEVILIVICTAVVLIGRQNHAPDTLQTLGFDLCDGEPCWHGIRPGMAWDTVQQYPLTADGKSRQVAIHLPPISGIRFDADKRGAKISGITIDFDYGPALPLTIGEIITRYGAPCRIAISLNITSTIRRSPTYYWIDLLYPTMEISFSNSGIAEGGLQLRPDAHVIFFQLITEDNPNRFGTCTDLSETEGQWYGFMSIDRYLARFAHAK